MRALCLGLVVLHGFLLAAPVAHGQHMLDLTETPQSSQSSSEGFGISPGVRGIEGQVSPRLPIEVRLDGIDETDLVVGRRIVSEVTIRNTGQSTLQLPWSATRHPSPDAEVLERRLHLTLGWTDQKGRRHSVFVVALFGSVERDGTLLELGPGETATIRAPGSLTASSFEPNGILTSNALRVDLRAVVHVSVSPRDWAEPVISANGIPVTLRLAGPLEP